MKMELVARWRIARAISSGFSIRRHTLQHLRCASSDSTPCVEGGVSARERGIAFEARVERTMRALDCNLTPTQTSMDGGIDHFGRWRLPDMDIEVVTQCKNEQKPVGVQYLREFYGVLNLQGNPSALAIFFSSSGFSVYAQRFFVRTSHPAILCTLSDDDQIVEFLLNDRARAVLPKLSVGSAFVNHQHELILTYGDTLLGFQ